MAFQNPYANAPRLPETGEIDPAEIVGPSRFVELEIGPGRGGFIQERLVAAPDTAVLGLEIRRKWAAIVDRRLHEAGLAPRGRVFAEDVRGVLPRFKPASIRAVFMHFPDPWWKKRHAKRRVASWELLADLCRVVMPGGELFYQTDVEERAAEVELMIGAEPRFLPWGETARIADNPYGAMSPRERRATADGLPIVRLRYRRAPATP